ncbi:FtsX-like permease family protein [Solidesulfovibrio sp.]|uniref:FtsX-like permease family protein n=1 Tax=Solidesulfovibrio sp. TaxID=2910990 RepID=UPI0026231323|nr:FtsX-like permease family protein [Solidesulfovibrio sp.]
MSAVPRNQGWLGDSLHVARLVAADLRYEWVLSVCLVLALGAIFTPLFILLGLKDGVIGAMRDRLQHDPDSRLVTPSAPLTTPLGPAWLEALRRRSAFVAASPTAYLMLDVPGLGEQVNAFPTEDGDPLLVENHISLGDDPSAVVVSERLAARAGSRIGDPFKVLLVRDSGREERYVLTFRLAGILPQPDVNKIWMSGRVFDGLYRWRGGQAFALFGLPGAATSLTPEYDGILTLARRFPTQEQYRRMVAGRSGFSQPPAPVDAAGWALPPGMRVMLWKPVGSRVFDADIEAMVNQHDNLGYEVEAVPFLDNFPVMLESAAGKRPLLLTVLPQSLAPPPLAAAPGRPVAWLNPETLGDFGGCVAGRLQFPSGDKEKIVAIPVTACPAAEVGPGHVAVPRDLAGRMHAARREEATYHPETGAFDVTDEAIRYFRAYAASLAEVEGLVDFVRAAGRRLAMPALENPVSNVAAVRKILLLSRYMEQLYGLIVVVSGISCFFAVTADVHAGIRRKRRDMAMLQLLGLHTGALFLFPFLKSLVLVLGGILLSLAAYAVFGHVAAHVVDLRDASLTRLGVLPASALVGGILATTSVASLLAALSVLRIDPGEYIRE